MERLKIVSVAVSRAGLILSVPRPARHGDIVQHHEYPEGKANDRIEIQGFLCSDGTFLDRKDAYRLAKQNGQLKRRPGGYVGDCLFSEDLW